jgi:hypothetical protein
MLPDASSAYIEMRAFGFDCRYFTADDLASGGNDMILLDSFDNSFAFITI